MVAIKFLKRSTLQNSAWRFLLICFLEDNFSPTPKIRYDTGSSVSSEISLFSRKASGKPQDGKTQNEATNLVPRAFPLEVGGARKGPTHLQGKSPGNEVVRLPII